MIETRDIVLPSNGRLGYEAKLTVRGLTGADEKILYSGSSELAVDKLISRCIVTPEGYNAAELCEQDKYFILMQVRMITFGSQYSFEAECPKCKAKSKVTIDLSTLEVFYADESFDTAMNIKLPSSGDSLKLKLLTSKDQKEVNDRVARTNADRGTEYILRCAAIIDTINEEKKPLVEKQAYVESLSSRDINYIWNSYGKIKVGVSLRTVATCPSCGTTNEVGVVMDTEFFRPTDII